MITTSDKMKIIAAEMIDLQSSVDKYLAAKRENAGNRPTRGDGAEYRTDGYGVTHCVKDGLPQGSTVTAIRRKIVNIRDHLNELGKMV